MLIPVIFEDKNILVLHKPSGIVVHPFDFSDEYTLIDFIREHSPISFDINNEITLQDKRVINIGGIVHKLDRDTSGVIVIAKNIETFNALRSQFRNHEIRKEYIALIEGHLDDEAFTINAPLGRSKKDYKQSTNPERARGELREAVTDVKVIKKNDKSTLVLLTPKTGRTHQLRAHMAHIKHPIVGDKAYGSETDSERIMLHSKLLSFTLEGEEYSFEAISDEFIEK